MIVDVPHSSGFFLTCVDACLATFFDQERGRGRRIEEAIVLLREEGNRCVGRLETVLALVGQQHEDRMREAIRAARARLGHFAASEGRALRAVASSAPTAR